MPTLIDIDPDVICVRSKGRWITCYIELPSTFDISLVNASTICINSTISIDPEAPIKIGDFNENGIKDLMVKFDRQEFIRLLKSTDSERRIKILLAIEGSLTNSIKFKGYATIFFLGKCWPRCT